MIRTALACLCLIAVAPASFADSIRRVELPELVGRSDLIVIGMPEPAPFGVWDGEHDLVGYDCRISEVLYGEAGKRLSFPRWKLYGVTGEPQVVFLMHSRSQMRLAYPLPRPASHADEVRQLILMKHDPKKYMADPVVGASCEFIELLTASFREWHKVGGCDRAAVATHARSLLSHRDAVVVHRAVQLLEAIFDRDSAKAVVPLLKHKEDSVRLAAVRYLEQANDRVATGPLCDLFDTLDGGEVASEISRTLGHLRDPKAVPALERALKRGVRGWTGWALGTLGGTEAFELLLSNAEKSPGAEGLGGLGPLVYRSNKKAEPWMSNSQVPKDGLTLEQRWRKWWETNKGTFKVTKTPDEAFGKR